MLSGGEVRPLLPFCLPLASRESELASAGLSERQLQVRSHEPLAPLRVVPNI